jgi:hypothetical protein
MMPSDNPGTVAAGGTVLFPQDGPLTGTSIARTGPGLFNLVDVGTYLIMFNVSITEPGQLVLAIGGNEYLSTTSGRATGTSLISQSCMITTIVPNTTLEVRNPLGSAAALTVTQFAGGVLAATAHLVVVRLF